MRDGVAAVPEDPGFVETLVGDGRPLLTICALVLLGSGAFALFLGATGQFLPHDIAFLGMTSQALCSLHGCRIVHFMIHDRVSFGGVLVAIGVMYLWLVEFPLKRGETWAWWTLTASSAAGFLSFLSYLGYGYLDTWHGVATLGLLPLFGLGLWRTRGLRRVPVPRPPLDLATRAALGRALLLAATFGMMAAGAVISVLGATLVFVPQDLEFMGINPDELRAINARLIPLIAHDRAGFGGAILSGGIVMFLSVLYGRVGRGLGQALALAGIFGFGAAIGVHPAIGYTSVSHLAPAVTGCLVYVAGLFLAWPARRSRP
ncbi:MAG: hypothetical protein ACHQKZ_02835 [Solirubrobacterales bacterium]|jgi:hypothetical protein